MFYHTLFSAPPKTFPDQSTAESALGVLFPDALNPIPKALLAGTLLVVGRLSKYVKRY